MQTHKKIVNEEMLKLKMRGFNTFTELSIGKYKFDLVGVNFKTKEVEIIEVDFSVATDKAKMAFAKQLGTLKIVHSKKTAIDDVPENIMQIGNALSDVARIKMLFALSLEELTYSGIMAAMGYLPAKDAGRMGYHIRVLVGADLITASCGWYELTELGEKVTQFLKSMVKTG